MLGAPVNSPHRNLISELRGRHLVSASCCASLCLIMHLRLLLVGFYLEKVRFLCFSAILAGATPPILWWKFTEQCDCAEHNQTGMTYSRVLGACLCRQNVHLQWRADNRLQKYLLVRLSSALLPSMPSSHSDMISRRPLINPHSSNNKRETDTDLGLHGVDNGRQYRSAQPSLKEWNETMTLLFQQRLRSTMSEE